LNRYKLPAVYILLTIAAAVAMMVLAFKWFDWWGGWCYGYRPIVDTMPYVVLLLVPVIGWIFREPGRLGFFLLLIMLSFGVQLLGAFSYYHEGWNNKHRSPPLYLALMPDEEVGEFTAPDDRSAYDKAVAMGAIKVVEFGHDIDRPQNRHRLLSVTDNQIFYFLFTFVESRQIKEKLQENP